MVEQSIIIETNGTGLHARPAGQLVSKTTQYKCTIKLICDDREIDGKSILGIMAAGIQDGTELTIQCDGIDEAAALEAMILLLQGMKELDR